MTEENIQSILDKLGSRVSYLSEENRICKLQNNAGKELINQLEPFIESDDWVSIYESSDNPNNGIAREYAYQYSGGAWAFMYLWSLEENNLQKIMVDYYKQWAEKENANPL